MVMTKLLEKAVRQASQLSDSGQDAIAARILQEIRRYQDIRGFAERFGGTEIDLDQDLAEEGENHLLEITAP